MIVGKTPKPTPHPITPAPTPQPITSAPSPSPTHKPISSNIRGIETPPASIWGTTGKYFKRDIAAWDTYFGKSTGGSRSYYEYVKQCRDGQEVWNGQVRLFKSYSMGGLGHRSSRASSGQWQSQDYVVKQTESCSLDPEPTQVPVTPKPIMPVSPATTEQCANKGYIECENGRVKGSYLEW